MMIALRRHWPLLLMWLCAATLLIWFSWDRIVSREGWDPDDQLRMVQLRDFLGGQSWFDTTQYRMNAPNGAPMHWSRLVELPLALLVLLFTPLLGSQGAEMLAGTLVPLLCLGGIAALLAGVATKIGGRGVGIVAFWLALIAPALLLQLRPMRIDHHGWQIFCAVLGFATLYWQDVRKAGMVLGAALAIWAHISLEGMPMTAAFFLYLGWQWAMGWEAGRRLFWTLLSFTGLTLALFLATQPAGFGAAQYCDTMSPAHIWAIMGATALLLPACHLTPSSRIVRFAVCGMAGLAALAILLWILPHCTQGAFGDLDPVVRQYWYANVREGLPVWHQDGRTAATFTAPLLVALLGLAAIWHFGSPHQSRGLGVAAYFLIFGTILSALVFRTVSAATAFTIVPAAFCIVAAFHTYRKEPRLWVRLMLVPAVLLLLTSGLMANALYPDKSDKADSDSKQSDANLCASHASIQALAALPPSNIVAPFNLGPAILLTSQHMVLASSHHRNRAGMRDQIDLFRLPPDQAKRIIERRAITYIIACPQDGEMKRYKKHDPSGLWAQIESGRNPQWLDYQGTVGKGLMVWRVR